MFDSIYSDALNLYGIQPFILMYLARYKNKFEIKALTFCLSQTQKDTINQNSWLQALLEPLGNQYIPLSSLEAEI